MTDLTGFSKRVLKHPRFCVRPEDPEADDAVVVAIKDQLLIADSVYTAAARRLPEFELVLIGKLLDGPPSLQGADAHLDDVGIYEVKPLGSTELDIFDLTARLRSVLSGHPGTPHDIGRKVSPNHVLVPAMESHSCPWGPPTPIPILERPGLPAAADPRVRVTVIDSGYQWFPAWNANPLSGFLADPLGPFLRGVQLNAEYISTQPPWQPGGGWTDGTAEDVRSAGITNDTGASVIYALAGHANFIAGVIARYCPQARITIMSHNGTFDPRADDLPTEASVARSFCRSTTGDDVPGLIDLGFAFRSFENVISEIWDVAFEFMGGGTIGNGPLVVCPAGNQESKDQRYPAALGFANVIAVASAYDGKRDFSNYGEWITCSADGHDVDSTFLPVSDMPVEDAPPGSSAPLDFSSGWAQWNGTSFAAPRVVAEIANRMPENRNSAMLAWQALQNAYPNARNDQELGIEFPF